MTFPSFEEFFTAVHGGAEDGFRPYRWQSELADSVAAQGQWPWSIDVPTGMGKTAAIDVAVYELARQCAAGFGDGPRTAPQRIIHVVDRRTVIDRVAKDVRTLADRINGATTPIDEGDAPVLREVRAALRTLVGPGDDAVVHASAIHGQSPEDRAWLRSTGCSILSMTSHQFVSRLLMRGYGVSSRSRPIEAGLCGIDSLVLFDEPHLSIPAVQAICDAAELQSRTATESLRIPEMMLVLLGATLPSSLAEMPPAQERGAHRMNLGAEARGSEGRRRIEAVRELNVRWDTAKPTDAATVKALVRAVTDFWAQGPDGPERIVVFANTVAVAQKVYEELEKKRPRDRSGAPAGAPPPTLVTSRFRAIDRRIQDFDGPGTFVSTQCLEVGVDVSFDAMVTETCPWSSLTQRLGRLNRDGRSSCGQAVMVAGWDPDNDEPTVRKPSTVVYGQETLVSALRLLRALEQSDGPSGGGSPSSIIDVSLWGLAEISQRRDFQDVEPEGQAPRAATLHSGMIPLMTQTHPIPIPDLPVQAFIAGPDARAGDEVEVAWRRDLEVFRTKDLTASHIYPQETVSVSRAALRNLLEKNAGANLSSALSDLEGSAEVSTGGPLDSGVQKGWIRYWDRDGRTWRMPSARNTRDWLDSTGLVVLDSRVGGYDRRLGWTGVGSGDVDDVSIVAATHELRARNQHPQFGRDATLMVVLSRSSVLDALQRPGDFADPCEASGLDGLSDADWGRVSRTSDEDDLAEEIGDWARDIADAMLKGAGVAVGSKLREHSVIVEVAPASMQVKRAGGTAADRVLLADHSRQVAVWAGGDALKAGLADGVAGSIAQAGALHDSGKVWPRFQRRFAGGEEPTEPLAKPLNGRGSVDGRLLRERRRKADDIASVPQGWRHEALSIAIAVLLFSQTRRGSTETQDLRLLVHLVGSHHGWYRPMLPLVSGLAQAEGVGHADAFAELNRRFGPWGLVYLEAVLRLADWRASARPWESGSTGESDVEASVLSRWGIDSLADVRMFRRLSDEIEVGERRGPGSDGTDVPSAADRQIIRMEGLRSHPLTGWFSAVGLLAGAVQAGDFGATLRWEPYVAGTSDGVVHPGVPVVPVIESRFGAERLVREVFDSPMWSDAVSLSKECGLTTLDNQSSGFDRKSQKIHPASAIRPLLKEADARHNWFVLGLVGGTSASSSVTDSSDGQVALPIAAFANNSSYPALAINAVLDVDGRDARTVATTEAIASVDAGFAPEKCDGGMDRERQGSPLITGRWAKDGRVSRSALAPLALFGMVALGAGQLKGVGSRRNALTLPMPTSAYTFAELQTLAFAGPTHPDWRWREISADWIYRATKKGGGSEAPERWDGRISVRTVSDLE